MLRCLRFVSAGESHGPSLTAILEGLPAGLSVNRAALRREMVRRRRGFGRSARMRMESDPVAITGGVVAGKTTGGPVALHVPNADYANWRDKEIAPMTVPRPGHVDFAATVKYGYDDLRHGSERGSARETAMRLAAGALCKQLLAQFDIEVGGWVARIGSLDTCTPRGGPQAASSPNVPVNQRTSVSKAPQGTQSPRRWIAQARESAFALGNKELDDQARRMIHATMKAHDTLGGVLAVAALGVPIGLGSHVQWDRRLDARLAGALMSIPAIKGVEIGSAFANAGACGTAVHDAFVVDEEKCVGRKSNRAGGIEGGISNGQPVVARLAMKPISTTLTSQESVDLANGRPQAMRYERSDFCAVTRALPIAEAVLALVLADALLEKLGGDHLDEMRERFAGLPTGRVADFHLRNAPWHMSYEGTGEL
ncbi:MAG: chorismate synthase [Myxococcota bacterium]